MKLLSKYLLFAVAISYSEILSNDLEVNQKLNEVALFNLKNEADEDIIYSNIVENISISFMNLCNIENNSDNLLKFNEYFANLLSIYENQFDSIYKSFEKKGIFNFEDKSKSEIDEMISNMQEKYSEDKTFEILKSEFIDSFINSSVAGINIILEYNDEKLDKLLQDISEGSLDKLMVQAIKNLNNDENNSKDNFRKNAVIYYEAVSRIFNNYDYLVTKVISVDNLLLNLAKEKVKNLEN